MSMTKHNQGCEAVFTHSFDNSMTVVDFLPYLTESCVENSGCLAPRLLSANDLATFADNQALEGKNRDGGIL